MLIKQYLQTAKTEPVYREMYDKAMAGVKEHLVQETDNGMVFTGELQPSQSKAGRYVSSRRVAEDAS